MTAGFLVALLAVGAAPAVAAPPGDEVVRQAMRDEMARSQKSLHIAGEPRPHYMAYTVSDYQLVEATATFGAIVESGGRGWRTVRVELRAGDRKVDSGNFFGPSGAVGVGPLEDDYGVLRSALWLRSDEAYKRAVASYARKRAAEKAMGPSSSEAAFAFAEVRPAESEVTLPGTAGQPDQAALAKLVRSLSALPREYPGVHASRAIGQHWIVRRRTLTSDGGWRDESRSLVEVTTSLQAQADDGMWVRLQLPFQGASLADLPSLADMTKALRKLALDFQAVRKAPVGESGNAVVLFEGRAAGQLLRRLLHDHLSGTPMPAVAGGGGSADELAGRLGQHIGPDFLEVYDDPREPLGPGKVPLFGAYRADDEAVPAERVRLVEKGVLRSLLMSRTPRKEIARSNGHGRGPSVAGSVRGQPGVLYVSAGKRGLAPAALRARAVKEAKSAGKNVALYIVRAIEPGPAPSGAGRASVQPWLVHRLRGGREEPVRGITFDNVTTRSLRDIVALGKTPSVYNILTAGDSDVDEGGFSASLVTPAVLLRDVEVRGDTEKHLKPPLYPHPHFAASH